MQQKKLPSNLSLDELLKALENKDDDSLETIVEESNDDVLLFVTTLKINKGSHPIKKKLLYRLYHNWSDKPVTQLSFTIKLSYYIDHSSDSYLINENDFKLTNKVKKLLGPKKSLVKSKNYRQHFEYFLNKFNIKKGDDIWLESFMLYYLYDNWCYSNNRQSQLSDRSFFNLLNAYMGPYKLVKGKRQVFGFNKVLETILTPEYIKKAKEWGHSKYSKPKKTLYEEQLQRIKQLIKFKKNLKNGKKKKITKV